MQKKIGIVIADADAIIAIVNEDDANHAQAFKISKTLLEQNATLMVPVTAVIEAITALKRAINRPDLAKELIGLCESGSIPVVDVTADILPLAISYFNPEGSKQDTFFDAVISAIAKRNNAYAIFSFDKGYRKTNIPLISDLLQI